MHVSPKKMVCILSSVVTIVQGSDQARLTCVLNMGGLSQPEDVIATPGLHSGEEEHAGERRRCNGRKPFHADMRHFWNLRYTQGCTAGARESWRNGWCKARWWQCPVTARLSGAVRGGWRRWGGGAGIRALIHKGPYPHEGQEPHENTRCEALDVSYVCVNILAPHMPAQRVLRRSQDGFLGQNTIFLERSRVVKVP